MEQTTDVSESLKRLREFTVRLLGTNPYQSDKINLYETIIDTTLDGVMILDDRDSIVYANSKMAQILSMTVENMIGESYLMCVNPKDIQKAVNNLSQRRRGISDSYFTSLRRADGTDAMCQISSKPMFSHDGEYKGVITSISELTNGKLSRAQRIMMFDISLDPMVIISFDSTFSDVNEAFLITLGYEKSEVIGKKWSDFIHPDDLAKAKEAEGSLAEKNEDLLQYTDRYINKNGGVVNFQWRARASAEFKSIFATARVVI